MFHSKINKKRQAQMISIMQTLNDCPEEDRSQKVHSIKMLTAQELFDTKKYGQAMNIFKQLNIELIDVIKLIPELDNKPGKNGKIKGEDLKNAVKALVEYLRSKKRSVSEASGHDDVQAELIDTTMLKCYVQLNDHKALTDLLRLNNCELEEAEKILTAHEMFTELVILYQTRGFHRKALQLLKDQAKHSDFGQMGHRMTIEYLQQLGPENLDIIFEFSDCILKDYPEEALKIFIEDKMKVKSLPRESILDFLKRQHKSLVVPYLEHIIHTWNESNALFHDELINKYREGIMYKEASSEEDLNHMKSKLLAFLEKSSHYIPECVIRHFPTDSLFQERAAILEKLGRHEQALAIYIHILGDVNRAIQYCEKTHNSHDEDTRDIYIVLLQFLINPRQGPIGPMAKIQRHPRAEKPDLETVLSILEKHADKICPIKALSVLPDSVPLPRLKYYLQYALDYQHALKRSTQVLKALLYAEQVQIEELKEHYESKSILISEYNVCRVCKKKFRHQNALMRYPNGAVVHYSCGLKK